MPTPEEIATEWISKGYGTTTTLDDGSILLYHHKAPGSHRWHIHIGDNGHGGYATVKSGGIHIRKMQGLTNNKFSASHWADYIWKEAKYDTYKGGKKTRKVRRTKTGSRRRYIRTNQ